MKKIMILVLSLGLLVGCSSQYSVTVTDGDKTLVSGSDIKVTKQDYFEYILDTYGASKVLSDALTAIADKEITDQDKIDELLNERKETYASYAGGDLNEYATSVGYKDETEYVENALLPDVKQELLRNQYIEENFDSLIEEYQVTSFKKIVVDKESTALSLIKEATSEDAFDQLMEEYGSDAEDAGIVTKESTLDDNLLDQLDTLSQIKEDGVYDKAIQLSDDTYAVIYLYDTAKSDQSKYITALTSIGDLQEKIEGIYLKKYHFTVNDNKVKKAIKEFSDQYIE